MTKKIKKISIVLLTCMCLILIGCTKKNLEKEKIIMSVSSAQETMLDNIVYKFNSMNDKYEIIFETNQTEQIKNYKLEHNVLKGDIIAFDSYIEANNYSSQLMDLRTKEFITRYQVSITNYLKTANDELYVVPSIGKFYSNCYNMDMIKSYNYSVPTTLQEMITFAQRNEIKLDGRKFSKTSSTIGGEESLGIALAQLAFPYFLSTTKGNFFLKEYINGNTKMNSDEYSKYFSVIFKNLLYLYDLKFYSLDDINKTFDDGLNEFVNKKTILIQNSIEYPLNPEAMDMNCAFVPFVGEKSHQQWIASKPIYYLTINKNVSNKVKDGIYEFFEYFSSLEGQHDMINYGYQKDQLNNNFVTYLKDSYIKLDDMYKEIENVIRSGRIFLIDLYTYVFNKNVESIISYLKKEISIEELFKSFDDKIRALNSQQRIRIESSGTFDFDTKNVKSEETLIANYIADAINKQMDSANAVCLKNGIIKANIYSDGIYLDELNIILDNSEIIYAKIKVKDLKEIISKLIEQDEMPIISGLRLELKNGVVKLYNNNKKELNDDNYINVIIDTSFLDGYTDVSLGKKHDILSIMTSYLEKVQKIEMPVYDKRYGE